MNKQLVLVLVLCVSALAQSTSCPGYNGNDLLQSGKNAIMRGKIGGTPEYSYDAPINFKVPSWGLEIAVSTSTIGDYNPLQTYGYNYYIEASRKGTTNSISYKLIMNNDESWTSIQLSYLVSGREDITVGNFEVPVNEWKSSSSNVYQISNKIARTLPQANYKVAAFISGFSTVDSQFGLTVNQKSYDADTKRVNVTFYSSANPSVLTVTITYVVYPEIHAVLDFSYSLTPKGDTGSYQISGPVNFQPNKRVEYNEWRVENRNLPCTGDKCTNICVLREECSQKGGSIYEGKCIYCGEGIIFEYGQCTRRCGMNQIYLNRVCICATGFIRKGKDCVAEKKCGTNEIWSDSLNACTCNKGCARFVEECKECPTGSEPTTNGKSCVCKDTNTIFDDKTLTCKPRCLTNQQWINNRCECVANHCWWNQVCRVCPSNSDVSKDQTTCICKSSNAFFNAQTNLCVECKANEILDDNNNQCVCKTGFTKVNGVCTVSCKDNEILDTKTNKCACKDGFVLEGSVCKSKCVATIETWDGKACVCASNYVKYNNVCKQCPTGSTVNTAKTACVCSNANQIFSETNFKCETCQENASPNAAKTACVCKSGYIAKGNLCVLDCKEPEILSSDNKICECISGYERKSSGKCELRCTNNQVWDGKTCVCSEGFARYNNVCRQCPTGSTVNSDKTACVCSNANQIFDATKFSCQNCQTNSIPNSNKTTCICNAGYVLNGASCIPSCKDLEILSADKNSCQCKDGYVRSTNGQCETKCDANSEIWDGKVCVCASNYAKYNNVCKQCPTGSAPNAAKIACVCTNANSILNPTKFACEVCQANSAPNANKDACVCNNGYTLKSGVCTLDCKQYEVISNDGKTCECQNDYVKTNGICQPRCTIANEVWNGKACVCVTNFAKYNNACRQCPTGSAPNTAQTACVCSNANSIFNPTKFACEVCQANSAPNANKDACVCNTGYTLKSGVCTLDCKQYEVISNDGKTCECQNDYVRTNGVCQPRCTVANEVWNGKTCVCVANFAKYNNACRQCPTGSAPNADQTACVCSINSSIFNPTKFVCEICPTNATPNANKDTCVCISGFLSGANGICVRDCKDPFVLNVLTGNCECKSGFIAEGNTCKSRCLTGETWENNACICAEGSAKYTTCRVCPAGTLPNAARTACICTGANQIFQSDKFSCLTCQANSKPNANFTECVCNDGFTKTGSTCVLKCGANEVANNDIGKCECIFGYIKTTVNGICSPRCKANEEYNGNQCICKPGCGYFKNECTVCPTDATSNPSRSSCLCIAPNFIFNQTTYKCQSCPVFSTNNDDDTKCVCNTGYELIGSQCIPTCQVNEELTKDNVCDCKWGFMRLGPQCVERCSLNQEWNGTICKCKENYVYQNFACRACPDGMLTNPARTTCLCKNSSSIFDFDTFKCVAFPENCKPCEDYSCFECLPGYKKENKTCVNTCPSGSFPDPTGKCVCAGGNYFEGGVCKKPVTCPAQSTWSTASLECVCDNKSQNLIDGVCKACGSNSIFSVQSKKCICQTGFFSIAGECRTCDARTRYDGNDCICSWGYYGNRDKCNQCHASCNTCTGPEANQCITCSDVSLVLQNGFCSRNTPCNPGFFLDSTYTQSCQKCTDNCIICDNIFECQNCAVGYKEEKYDIAGQKIVACAEVCGDGIRYEAECDDGNTVNGDGCSSTCNKEPGWECTGGSSAQKSTCRKFIPDSTYLEAKGAANLGGKVVQSIRANYLPTCLTQNECSKCFRALKVSVVDANVPILVTVQYIYSSQYQFLIEYDFQGLYVTSKFKTLIKLNDEFKGCLADEDFDNQLELTIDPAFLAKFDAEEELTLEEIIGDSAISVPKSAKALLGLN